MAKRFRLPDTPLPRSSDVGIQSNILPNPTPETWADLVDVLELGTDTLLLSEELRGRLKSDHVAGILHFDGWARVRAVCDALQTGKWTDFTDYDSPEDERREMLTETVDAVGDSVPVTFHVLRSIVPELMKSGESDAAPGEEDES